MPTLAGLQVHREVKYVFAPHEDARVRVVVDNRTPHAARVAIAEHAPAGYTSDPATLAGEHDVAAGHAITHEYTLRTPAEEGPALLDGTVRLLSPRHEHDLENELVLVTPIAVYARVSLDAPERLVEVRPRLVAVTNFHRVSGWVLMLDAVEYFTHHLNVALTPALAKLIAQEFAFTKVGLPVPRAILDEVRHGDRHGPLGVKRILLEGDDTPDDCDELYRPTHGAAFRPEVR